MVDTIELRTPVLIDDVKVRELTHDIEQISSEQFLEAETLAGNVAARMRTVSNKVVELDATFHYYLGVMAILAVNPDYSVEDIERIKGPDVLKVMKVGRNFMIADAEEDEDEDSASTEDAEEDDPESYLPTLE